MLFRNTATLENIDRFPVRAPFADYWLTSYSIVSLPALSSLYIHDKESYDELDLALNPVSTGAYVVTDYVVNSHIYLEARDGYWGPEPAIKNINFIFLNEDSQRVNALTTGDADVARIPIQEVGYIETLGNYDVRRVNAAQASTAYFNITEGEPLDSLEARMAVMHAIDRQAIVDMAFDGQTTIPRWPLSEYNVDFEERMANMHEVYSIGYDPVRAKALAEQSGLTGKTLRIAINGQSDNVTIAEIMQNCFEEIGVNSQIISFDQATYFSLLMDESNFDIGLYFIASPDGFAVDCFFMYPQFFTLGWTGPERDYYLGLGAQGVGIADQSKRSDILYEQATIFSQLHLWYALTEYVNVNVVAKGLVGVDFYLNGTSNYTNWAWS